MVIYASHLEMSDFGEPVCGHFFSGGNWLGLVRKFSNDPEKWDSKGLQTETRLVYKSKVHSFIKLSQKSGKPREYQKNRIFVKKSENLTRERY